MSDDIAQRLMSLFAGFDGAHGTHGMPERDPNGVKWSIKKTARTLDVGPTLEMWAKHLAGERPLGVVPIMSDNTCLWGSIDIDKYNIDQLELVARIEAMKLPLVPCRSKSNGLHLFLFCSEPVPAALMQLALRNLAATLGFAKSEIFPKQTTIDGGRGDSGSWMVMPYFGDTFGGKLKLQYGLKATGAEMTVAEFVEFAERSRISEQEIAGIRDQSIAEEKSASGGSSRKTGNSKKTGKAFSDGPPCLQTLAADGFPEGGRNNALVHIGVYLKKKFPDSWEAELEDAHRKYVSGLSSDEVVSAKRSLRKKDYEYLCKHEPMCSVCDTQLCSAREFGVGDGSMFPVITAWRKVESSKPVWYMTLKGTNRELVITDADAINSYPKFQKLCIEQLDMYYMPLSREKWTLRLRTARALLETVKPTSDTTDEAVFKEVLDKFLTNRQRGQSIEDLHRDVPWEDEEAERFYFKMAPLAKLLAEVKMRETRRTYAAWIEDLGGGYSDSMKTKIGSVKAWWVPSSIVNRAAMVPPPPLPKEPL